ncbi:XRE family transcriptional regulator [Cryobacterium psychrophilum]|nr:cupin domain-containing protein [Cryobacterium psychrophilum]TDW29507.1 XRE family transcriptional regulator [Cryobacterium psychrophilum]
MEDLGAAIRAVRVRKGMSLRSVAAAAEISPSLLSQVETGRTRPSVGTLYALVNILEVSIDELLGLPQRASSSSGSDGGTYSPVTAIPVQRAADNPTIVMENGVTWERLAVEGSGMMDALLTSYDPGSSSSVEGKQMRHSGVEYGYVIEGEVTLRLGFDTYVLRAGDSMCFDSRRPHLYENRTDKTARGIWYVLGRSQEGHSAYSAPKPMNSAVDVLGALGPVPGRNETFTTVPLP